MSILWELGLSSRRVQLYRPKTLRCVNPKEITEKLEPVREIRGTRSQRSTNLLLITIVDEVSVQHDEETTVTSDTGDRPQKEVSQSVGSLMRTSVFY